MILEGYFKASGTSFVDSTCFEILKMHETDAKLYLVRDYNNRYDQNAISIVAEITFQDGTKKYHVGWYPREDNKVLAYQMDQGKIYVNVDKFDVIGGTPDKPNYGIVAYCTLYTGEDLQRLNK